MKKFKVPMEMDASNFDGDYAGDGQVNYDGGQKNGRHGAPILKTTSHGDNVSDYGTQNWDNTQIEFGSIEMVTQDKQSWQKKMGVFTDPTKNFKDLDSNDAYEVNLKPHVHVTGMHNPNQNHNSSTDC